MKNDKLENISKQLDTILTISYSCESDRLKDFGISNICRQEDLEDVDDDIYWLLTDLSDLINTCLDYSKDILKLINKENENV